MTLLTAIASVAADSSKPIPLWPNSVPGGKLNGDPEKDTTTAKDHLVGGKPVIRLGNITEPSLTFYPASASRNTGATVVVFPGGAYRILALDLEGTEICDWLNSIGVNAALVKYRVPEAPDRPRYAAPLQDAQRAFGIVRSKAGEWRLDPKRIGVLGFSAGGHLAALLSNDYQTRSYESADAADGVSCRPDFTILIYPAYLVSGDKLDTLAPEFHVSSLTPTTFLIQTEDDSVHVENSLVYYRALKDAKVPAEMHIFTTGGHGYGMRPSNDKVTTWPKLASEWLATQGLLGPMK